MKDRIILSNVKNIKDIIHAIDEYQKGVIAVVDDDNKLIGIVTDGDLPETITNTNVLLLSKRSAKNSKLNSLKKNWTKRLH